MREYRGQRVDNGEWVFGSLLRTNRLCHILSHTSLERIATITTFAGYEVVAVKRSTVGQNTGIDDKNGKMIFEGDIVQWKGEMGQVVWDREKARFNVDNYYASSQDCSCCAFSEYAQFTIIGDIHTPPKLQEKE